MSLLVQWDGSGDLAENAKASSTVDGGFHSSCTSKNGFRRLLCLMAAPGAEILGDGKDLIFADLSATQLVSCMASSQFVSPLPAVWLTLFALKFEAGFIGSE